MQPICQSYVYAFQQKQVKVRIWSDYVQTSCYLSQNMWSLTIDPNMINKQHEGGNQENNEKYWIYFNINNKR